MDHRSLIIAVQPLVYNVVPKKPLSATAKNKKERDEMNMKMEDGDSPKLHLHDRVERFILGPA